MKRELKIMKESIDWVNPHMGIEISRLLNHEREPVRMVLCGNAGILYGSLTRAEMNWIQEHHPEVLTETDEEGEVQFRITFEEDSPGTIDQAGVNFGSHISPDGFPQVTILFDTEIEDGLSTVSEAL